MLEMRCSLDHDDNISDYTESVFLMRDVMQQQPEKSSGSGRYMKGTKERTGNRDRAGSGGLSARFTPVYVGSEAVEERSGEDRSGTSSAEVTDVGGVAPLRRLLGF